MTDAQQVKVEELLSSFPSTGEFLEAVSQVLRSWEADNQAQVIEVILPEIKELDRLNA